MKRRRRLMSVVMAMWLLVSSSVSTAFAMEKPTVKVESAMVIDSNNGQILYEKSPNKLLDVGTLSQWLSVYLVYQAVDSGTISLKTVVPISQEAYALSQDYDIANVPLRQDFEYTVEELLEVVAMTGAHGALLALSELVERNHEQFMTKMTEQLSEWGIDDYEIVDITGLPKDYEPNATESLTGKQNRLTAVGLATIGHHLMKQYPQYALLANRDKKQFKANTDDPFEMTNRNPMFESNANGYKSIQAGLANESEKDGHSYISAATENDVHVVSVVMGNNDEAQVYADTKTLLEYVRSSYRSQALLKKGDAVTQVGEIKVVNSTETEATLVYGSDMTLTVPVVDTTPRYDYTFVPEATYFNPRSELIGPLEAQTHVGNVTVQIRGKDIYFLEKSTGNQVPVVLQTALPQSPWYVTFWRMTTQTVSHTWENIRKFFTEVFN